MQRLFKICILMIILLLTFATNVFAADFTISANVQKNEKEYIVTLLLDKITTDVEGINVFSVNFEYDKDAFEKVKKEDIISKNRWNDVTYNEETGKMLLFRSDFTKESKQEIIEIKLTQKENLAKNKTEIKFLKAQASDSKINLRADDITINVMLDSNNSGIKSIIIYILIGVIVLLVLRIVFRTKTKRRKVR